MNLTKLILILTTLSPALATAQADDVPEVSREPLSRMQALAPLAGDWTVTTYTSEDDGASWNLAGTQAVAINFAHKGFMLEEVPGDLSSPGFHMHTMITYDQYRKVYRKAALDDIWGIFDLYEGQIVGEQLILDNLTAKTFFPLGDGRWRGFRLTIDLGTDERKMLVESTDDDGQSWQARFKLVYLPV